MQLDNDMLRGSTESFVEGLLALSTGALPHPVIHATKRTLLNVVGTSIGASQQEAVDIVCDVATGRRGPGTTPVPGRNDRLDPLSAALAIGVAAHLDDFDDTHLATVIHPGAATLGALWPLAIERDVSGDRFLTAFALGIEAQLRLGLSLSPWHYDDGWHITGTCGPLGAAIGAAVLLDLPRNATLNAVGIAASSTVGIREAFGTMMKPFHAGKAAENGILAALLAEQGMTSRHTVLESPRGFANVMSPRGADLQQLTIDLGSRWELEENTFKPYPCGIVSHPAIEAAIELAACIDDPSSILAVRARVHPLVPELTGNHRPTDGLQARFSTVHGIAAALADGEVGLPQYSDDSVTRADVARLREVVELEPDANCGRDEATVTATLASGSVVEFHVLHARGSLARPLRDAELASKVRGLVEPVMPGATDPIVEAVDRLDTVDSIAALVAACTPRGDGA